MEELKNINKEDLTWTTVQQDGLHLEYARLPLTLADNIFAALNDTLEYYTGDLTKIKVFGKVYPLPRQQVAYGDAGLTYTFSGLTVPALPWPAPVAALRDFLHSILGIRYDFVLVNKYRNGADHMGEHRDNEPELDVTQPIASVSFGQERPFVLKHKDSRKARKDRNSATTIPPVNILLEHGSILLMQPPTNEIWYHSLPARKKLSAARINLTFRKMCIKRIRK